MSNRLRRWLLGSRRTYTWPLFTPPPPMPPPPTERWVKTTSGCLRKKSAISRPLENVYGSDEPGGVRKPTVISAVSASGIQVKPSFGMIENAATIDAAATPTTMYRWLIAHPNHFGY